jgi:hypothetical protein
VQTEFVKANSVFRGIEGVKLSESTNDYQVRGFRSTGLGALETEEMMIWDARTIASCEKLGDVGR